MEKMVGAKMGSASLYGAWAQAFLSICIITSTNYSVFHIQGDADVWSWLLPSKTHIFSKIALPLLSVFHDFDLENMTALL